MEESKNEILKKLREAGVRNYFTLTLKLNGSTIEEIDFPADKYDTETLLETRTYFLMSDLKKKVLEEFSKNNEQILEKRKKEQIEKLWKEKDKE